MERSVIALVLAASCASTLAAEPQTYRVVAEDSRFEVDVGRSGLFKMFGHDHLIHVRSLSGVVVWDDAAPEASSFELAVDPASLEVDDEGLSADDRAEVQSNMETTALALSDHSEISFVSTGVDVRDAEERTYRLEVTGELLLRGTRRALEVPLTLSFEGERVVARGKLELASDQWGVPQISVAGGTVKTKKELGMEFEIVLQPEP